MSEDINKLIDKMPVVILAGGSGANLGASGRLIPKPMVEVNGAPLLLYVMDHYSKFGFKKFIICAGYGAEEIKEFVRHIPSVKATIERSKWDTAVVDTGVNSMTGSRLAQIRPMIDSSETFCLTYGDTLSDVNLRDMLVFHMAHKRTATLLAVHPPTRFRILGLYGDDNLVRGFAEGPILQNDYINGGFYIFNNEIFSLKALKKEPACVLETDVLESLVASKQLCAFRYSGFWQYVDTERDRQKLCARFIG